MSRLRLSGTSLTKFEGVHDFVAFTRLRYAGTRHTFHKDRGGVLFNVSCAIATKCTSVNYKDLSTLGSGALGHLYTPAELYLRCSR